MQSGIKIHKGFIAGGLIQMAEQRYAGERTATQRCCQAHPARYIKNLRYGHRPEPEVFIQSNYWLVTSTHLPFTPAVILLSYIASQNVPGRK